MTADEIAELQFGDLIRWENDNVGVVVLNENGNRVRLVLLAYNPETSAYTEIGQSWTPSLSPGYEVHHGKAPWLT